MNVARHETLPRQAPKPARTMKDVLARARAIGLKPDQSFTNAAYGRKPRSPK